jgi:mono/diheme cytochrome c family protein
MSKILVRIIGLTLITVLATACGGQLRKSGRLTTILSLDRTPSNGATVFEDECSYCHGDTAMGGSAPNLSTATKRMTDGEIVEQILEGGLSMPSIEVTEQQAVDVVAWLRAKFPPPTKRP